MPPLDFTSLHVVCLSGDNGHGKSALLDAITWAIWGEARKAASDRKPDERLLRMGTADMLVEFEFDLEGNRYRILRQYRSGRGGKSTLEFQVFSPESDAYHSLTQPSLTATQQRITDTLRMGYTTFINSVFILQGRADEFTRRSARERKEILADILDLWRYEELEERAREHAERAEKTAMDKENRLRQIDETLEDLAACDQRIEGLTATLRTLSAQMNALDADIGALRIKEAEANTLVLQMDELETRKDVLEKEYKALHADITRRRAEIEAFRAALSEREAIEQAHQEWLALSDQQTLLDQTVHVLRPLEQRKTQLERDIERARYEVEKQQESLKARQASLKETLEETRGLIEKREAIEKSYQKLLRGRQVDEQWEEKRRRHEDLEQQWRTCRDDLLSARSALQSELGSYQHRFKELQAKAATLERLQTQAAGYRQQVKELQALDQKRQEIAERGRTLNAHIEVLKNKIKLYEHENDEANAKLKVLRRGTKANCPLCDAALDERRRETIEINLGDLLQQHAVEIQKFERGIRIAEEEKKQLAVQYKEYRPRLEALPKTQQSLAAAEAAVQEAAHAAQEAHALQRQMTALQERIDTHQYAPDLQEELERLQSELNALGYDRDRHKTLQTQLRELQRFETEKARLEEAQERHAAAAAALQGIEEERAKVEDRLAQRAYAPEAYAQLRAVETQIRDLGYDETAHQRLKQRRDALKDIPAQKEKLDLAIRQHDTAREALKEQENRAQALKEGIAALTQRIEELEKRSEEIGEVNRQLQTLQEQRQALQREMDETNRGLGAEQQNAERYRTLAAERPTVEEERQQAAKDRQIYEKLALAFGKDGIQALIIENAIPEIEEEANRILGRLTGNRTQITIEPLRNLKTGGTKETLDIHISDEMGTRPYELYSGGEAFRTNFALRIAISKLLAHRAGTRLRTLIIDEGFGTQDTQGLEYLIDALQGIQDDFEKIIVVTHLERLKNAFPARIEVTKYPDIGSRFEVFV